MAAFSLSVSRGDGSFIQRFETPLEHLPAGFLDETALLVLSPLLSPALVVFPSDPIDCKRSGKRYDLSNATSKSCEVDGRCRTAVITRVGGISISYQGLLFHLPSSGTNAMSSDERHGNRSVGPGTSTGINKQGAGLSSLHMHRPFLGLA